MAKVNFGWLKDKDGKRFAPKTLISKVFDKNGKPLEKILEELKRNSGNDAVDVDLTELQENVSKLSEEKLDKTALPKAINTALEQAKESGEFNGKDGVDGYTPQKGIDYFDGEKGETGEKGADGYTPVKGTDYFTDSDKAELVTEVLDSLPTWQGGAF